VITIQDIKDFIEAHPDQRNLGPKNRYFNPDGSPCCVFGHIFVAAGIPECSVLNERVVTHNACLFDSTETVEFASDVQVETDCGVTWGEALKAAQTWP
jgi:hypothetical protein